MDIQERSIVDSLDATNNRVICIMDVINNTHP
jgi:hypothetical protein